MFLSDLFMNRSFIKTICIVLLLAGLYILYGNIVFKGVLKKQIDVQVMNKYPRNKISDFCKRLLPVGRILESEGYYVWCCTPIYGEDGKVHVFYSRWPD